TNTVVGSFTVRDGRNFSTGAFSNLGDVTVGSGSRFTTSGAYTQLLGSTTLEGGQLTAATGVNLLGGVLSGSGTVNGNVRNGGVVSPGGEGAAGILTINGDYTQMADGTLDLDIGGLAAGSEYDQLQVSGLAALDGALNVSLINGFFAQEGDSF